jgi:ATP-dependent helicase Lhr and Lhr-like helicase
VSHFEKLHPALQHHIVNSLGWKELRPLQELSIGPVLARDHALLIAPTAGGKTESAIFPLLSRMLTEEWDGLSILYICPLKALLNNLHERLEYYLGLVGRSCAVWHGDIAQSRRQQILRTTPDCLLTTPESLEAMLVSRKVEHRQFFASLRAVVVDEIHAFAGDDRGWHLLFVLERISRLAPAEPQRIGLSATVGNPDQLLEWFAGHCSGNKTTVVAPSSGIAAPEIQIDFVGSLENAAIVISSLHRGEKRLVFCDSRSRVEQIAAALRSHGVETYLSHSSLSVDQRRLAEAAFSQASNCVIVATSTLELGIDVGNLDRIIQIDCPNTVASFLQRIGRTGRRPGTRRNCLFLATSQPALHRTIALVALWEAGFVEPISAPAAPYHILTQQLLAIILQENGLGILGLQQWLGRIPFVRDLPREEIQGLLEHLVRTGILVNDQGVLGLGPTAEADYGYRYFSELLSVFTTPPVFTVFHGNQEVGTVDQGNFLTQVDGPRFLGLAGRTWRVLHVDWKARKAHVEPDGSGGKTRWMGGSPGLSYKLAQGIQRVAADETTPNHLSKRAAEALKEIRDEFAWVRAEHTHLLPAKESGRTEWWTFAGQQVNDTLADLLRHHCDIVAEADSLAVQLRVDVNQARECIEKLRGLADSEITIQVDPEAESAFKFSEILPKELKGRLVNGRSVNIERCRQILDQPLNSVLSDGLHGAFRPSRG